MAGQAKTKSRKNCLDADPPVIDLMSSIDQVFAHLGIDDAVFRNPSYNCEKNEKVAGLTHTYLRPLRIGRKAVFTRGEFYYGKKIDLLPQAYEIVSFEAPAEILSFMQDRIANNLLDYFSIHSGNQLLDVDIRQGEVINCGRIGFDQDYPFLAKGRVLTQKHLFDIISSLI